MVDRFARFGGYVVDRWLIRFFLVVLVLFTAVFIFAKGFESHVYVTCDAFGAQCLNPYYSPFCPSTGWEGELCREGEMLPAGFVYGEKEPAWFGFIPFFMVLWLFGGFVMNHWFYNRGWKFGN